MILSIVDDLIIVIFKHVCNFPIYNAHDSKLISPLFQAIAKRQAEEAAEKIAAFKKNVPRVIVLSSGNAPFQKPWRCHKNYCINIVEAISFEVLGI